MNFLLPVEWLNVQETVKKCFLGNLFIVVFSRKILLFNWTRLLNFQTCCHVTESLGSLFGWRLEFLGAVKCLSWI